MKRYLYLVKLQNETHGAAFTLCYSTRGGVHVVRFNNVGKVFRNASLNAVIEDAISFVENRRRDTEVTHAYTLFKR